MKLKQKLRILADVFLTLFEPEARKTFFVAIISLLLSIFFFVYVILMQVKNV